MKQALPLIALLAAAPALAEDSRQLDAHEHGVGALNIAIEGTTVAMEFYAPGADIVGFEYAANSDADRAAIDAAVATLAAPLKLFVFPGAAECSVTHASAGLESEEEHHEGHKEHDEHAKHEEHDKHADHDEHAEEAGHTEFHAEYMLTCAHPEKMTEINFAYFDTFENARELEVQVVSGIGAQAFEVVREAPTLDLRSLF
ncbi:MAG: zinc uptake protein ZrgA [Pikeienuella sp.]